MVTCCEGLGKPGGCPECGAILNQPVEVLNKSDIKSVIVPTWYETNLWNFEAVSRENMSQLTQNCIQFVDRLVGSSSAGVLPVNSYLVLLPDNCGKRIAMFTMIQNYLAFGYSVSPVLDIATLTILLNRNRYEDYKIWFSLVESDIVFVYGTEFATRKQTTKTFFSLSSTRALTNKVTIGFSNGTLEELSLWDKRNRSVLDNKKVEDKKAHPYIMDGVTRGY